MLCIVDRSTDGSPLRWSQRIECQTPWRDPRHARESPSAKQHDPDQNPTAAGYCHAWTHPLIRWVVALVAQQNLHNRFVGVLVNVSHPLSDVVERLVVNHIVHEQNAHRAAVVRCRKKGTRRGEYFALHSGKSTPRHVCNCRTLCDGPEALLPRRIPDLQFDFLSVQVDGANFEVNPATTQ